MEKNKSTGIKRLISYLKHEFIIDKAVDFILIFIGLYAALSLENSIQENENKNKYIQDLKNIYVEISKNKIVGIAIENKINEFSETADEIYSVYLGASKTSPGHFVGIITNEKFNDNFFNVLDRENFVNKTLLSDIFELYAIYQETMINYTNYLDNIEELGKLYYLTKNIGVNPPNWIGDLNITIQTLRSFKKFNIQNANVCFYTSESVKTSIENELSHYNINPDSIVTISESYDIAELYWNADKYLESYKILNKRLLDIKDNEMLGRYYEKLGIVILWDIKDNLDQLSEYNLSLEDAEYYFNKSLEMHYNETIIPIYLAMIYDYKDNDEKFYYYLNKALESGYDNFDYLEFSTFGHRSDSEKFIDLLNEYKNKKTHKKLIDR
tara:strand:+ start:3412 stop:4560 length:1149 start_codon:yes stop_codon:yes gene_type:complete